MKPKKIGLVPPRIENKNPDWYWIETVIVLNGAVELPIEALTASRFVFKYTYKNHKEGNVDVMFGMDK